MDSSPEVANSLAVNQAHLADAFGFARLQVGRDQRFDFTRMKSVQVQLPFDGNLQRFLIAILQIGGVHARNPPLLNRAGDGLRAQKSPAVGSGCDWQWVRSCRLMPAFRPQWNAGFSRQPRSAHPHLITAIGSSPPGGLNGNIASGHVEWEATRDSLAVTSTESEA